MDEEERPPQPIRSRRRDLGIDTLRYGCAFAVVVIHALPRSLPVPLWAVLVWSACVPAVPFFFIASGYFLRSQERFGVDIIVRPLRRLLLIYLFWILAYFVLLKVIPVQHWSFGPHDWLYGGTAYHLWFLPALGFALVFVGAGLTLVGPEWTGLACAALAGIALLRGSYHDVLHLGGTPSTHSGQLAGPLYVYIGAMLARRPIKLSWRWLAGLVVVAYGLVVGEELLISRLAGEPLSMDHDVVFSAFILGTAVFLAARAIPESSTGRGMAGLGQISLSVYAVHLLILWVLVGFIGNAGPWQVAVLAVAVFGLATAVSLGLQRVPGLRAFVR